MIKRIFKIIPESKYVILFSLTERIFFFLIFLIFARKFPVEIYGEVVTVFSISNIFMILFDLGLPVILQKETAVLKERSSQFLSTVILINLLFLPLYFTGVIIYCMIFFPSIQLLQVMLISLMVYFFSISNILNKALSGLSDFKSQFNSLFITRSLTIICFLCILFFVDTGINLLLLILMIGAFLQIISLLNKIRKNNLQIEYKNIDYSKIRSILKISIPLGLAVVFNFLYDKIDIVLISAFTDFRQTGFYNAGYGILKASVITYSFLFAAGLTRISSLSRNKRAVELFLKKYSVILLSISSIVAPVLFFGSDFIIRTLYSAKFTDGVIILKIISVAFPGLALNNLTGITLNGLGFFRQNMNVTLLGLIINVILNIIFIPKYGITAAAVVTVLTEYFILAGDYYYIRKYLTDKL